jgi:hypothetical protein
VGSCVPSDQTPEETSYSFTQIENMFPKHSDQRECLSLVTRFRFVGNNVKSIQAWKRSSAAKWRGGGGAPSKGGAYVLQALLNWLCHLQGCILKLHGWEGFVIVRLAVKKI